MKVFGSGRGRAKADEFMESPTQEIVNIDDDLLFDFGYSFDGQSLVVLRGGWRHDVVLIKDLRGP